MVFLDNSFYENGRIAAIDIHGPLNAKTAAHFENHVNRAIDQGARFIILNAPRLEYISSEGIGSLLYVEKKIMARSGKFLLAAPGEEVRKLLNTIGVSAVLQITDSFETAMDIMCEHIRPYQEKLEKESTVESAAKTEESSPVDPDLQTMPEAPAAPEFFANPLVVECEHCKSFVRVHYPGEFLCPSCHTRFTVNSEQVAIF